MNQSPLADGNELMDFSWVPGRDHTLRAHRIDFNANHFTGVSPIHWCITDVISGELSMRYAIFRRSLPMDSCEWAS